VRVKINYNADAQRATTTTKLICCVMRIGDALCAHQFLFLYIFLGKLYKIEYKFQTNKYYDISRVKKIVRTYETKFLGPMKKIFPGPRKTSHRRYNCSNSNVLITWYIILKSKCYRLHCSL